MEDLVLALSDLMWPATAKSSWFGSCLPWWGRFGSNEPHPAPRLQGPSVEAADLWICWLLTAHWCYLWFFDDDDVDDDDENGCMNCTYLAYDSKCNNQSFQRRGAHHCSSSKSIYRLYTMLRSIFLFDVQLTPFQTSLRHYEADVAGGLHKCPLWTAYGQTAIHFSLQIMCYCGHGL